MADQVQRLLEAFLPELQLYHQHAVFTRQEIRSIVLQRRDFEYKLQKPYGKTDPTTYFQYIEYELNLDALRAKRMKRLGIKATKDTHVLHYSLQRHVIFLYERLLKRYSHVLQYWLIFLQYLKSVSSYKTLFRAYTYALQHHPYSVQLWQMLIDDEIDIHQDIDNARVLMQRALRINSTQPENTKQLFHSFFAMEVNHVGRLLERKRRLGLLEKQASSTTDSTDQDDNLMSLDVKPDAGTVSTEAPINVQALYNLILPIAIYRNAIQRIPNDVHFRLGFLQYLPHPANTHYTQQQHPLHTFFSETQYEQPKFEVLMEQILQAVMDDIVINQQHGIAEAHVAKAVEAIAAYQLNKTQHEADNVIAAFDAGVRVYDTALQHAPSTTLYDSYCSYIRKQMDASAEDEEHSDATQHQLQQYIKVVYDAVSKQFVSIQLVTDYVSTMMLLEQMDEAARVLADVTSINGQHHGTPALWLLRLQIQQQPSNDNESMQQLYTTALKQTQHNIDQATITNIWLLYIQHHSTITAGKSSTYQLYEQAIQAINDEQSQQQLKVQYLDYCTTIIETADDLPHLTQAVKFVQHYGHITIDLLCKCIDVQQLYAEHKALKPSVIDQRIRALFERLVNVFGKEHAEVWQRYIAYEMEQSQSQRAQNLLTRAQKTLTPAVAEQLTKDVQQLKPISQ